MSATHLAWHWMSDWMLLPVKSASFVPRVADAGDWPAAKRSHRLRCGGGRLSSATQLPRPQSKGPSNPIKRRSPLDKRLQSMFLPSVNAKLSARVSTRPGAYLVPKTVSLNSMATGDEARLVLNGLRRTV